MRSHRRARPSVVASRFRHAALASCLLLAPALAHAGQLESAAAGADAGDEELERLGQLSLEELMRVQVISVAGTQQSLFGSPAALTVITAEDIRRAGHRHVAEALRMVPGMFVGRVNASSWVVGARGLTGSTITSTRYLVLVDGRVVYDPLISTTFWDTVDLVFEDIDRIEVIRGPGATLWGVNAMNGVINIITRESKDTQGVLAKFSVGGSEPLMASVRYGGRVDEDTTWRAWAKYAARDGFELADGTPLHDQWSSLRAGFRADGRFDAGPRWILQGEAYAHPRAMASVRVPVPGVDRQFEQVTGDDDVDGAYVMFRAYEGLGEPRGWRVRGYLERTHRDTARFGVRRGTAELDFRAWRQWGGNHELVWGLQASRTQDEIDNGPVLVLDPDERGWTTFNAFVQDTAHFADDRWHVMLGSKFTHHEFVGFQVQPSARAWFTPDDRHTLWAAYSRPVRVPSRFEEDGLLVFFYADAGAITTGVPNGVIVPVGLGGHDALRPERLNAWELGHRMRVGDNWVVDTALFHNDYTRLIGVPPAIFGAFTDAGRGRTYGFDVSASGQVTPDWRIAASYSRLDTRIDGPVFDFEERSNPMRMAQLRSQLDIGNTMELDAAVYYVDRIPQQGIDAYTRLDVGFTWRPRAGQRWSIWGQNLLEAGHSEASGAQVPRSVYLQVVFGSHL